MFYIIETRDGDWRVLKDQQGNMLKFWTEEKANIERIYLQPEYDNLLKIKGIK